MGFIIIDKIKNNNKKIMIFSEGTILKPKHNNFFSRINVNGYVPIGNAREIIKNENNFYKNTKHIIKKNNNYYLEREFLEKKYKNI